MKACARCGTELDPKLEVFRTTACASCRADLHCCINCNFYQKGAHWDCRETISEQVVDKERGNFCDFFRFAETRPGGKGNAGKSGSGKSGAGARKDFNKLFGD
jgi:hypothetical protein